MGIEPTSSAWKAEVLPLNYTRPKSIRFLIQHWVRAIALMLVFIPGPDRHAHRRPPGGGGRIRTSEG